MTISRLSNFPNIRRFLLLVGLSTSLILLMTGCGSDDQRDDPDSTATVVESTPVSSPADGQGKEVSRPANAEGIAPTAPPPPKSDYDADGDGWLSWDELSSGVYDHFGQFEWPANYTTSPEMVLERRAEPIKDRIDETTFENGSEISLPGEAHFCAWAYNWMDGMKENNDVKMIVSMQQIEDHTLDLPSIVYVRSDVEALLNKAKLGDPSDLLNMMNFMCDPSIFEPEPFQTPISVAIPQRS